MTWTRAEEKWVNGTFGLSLSQVFLESVSEDGQLTIGLEATESLLGLQQAGGGPSERHLKNRPWKDTSWIDVYAERLRMAGIPD